MQKTQKTRDEILRLEKQFWDAMKVRDPDTAKKLSDDVTILVGPQGIGEIKRDSVAAMIEQSPYELTRYAFQTKDTSFKMIGDNVAIVAYRVKEELVVDGENLDLEAFETTVWVKRDGAWVAALHTETLPGDPFGRDRRERQVPRSPKAKPSPRRTSRTTAKKPTRQRARRG